MDELILKEDVPEPFGVAEMASFEVAVLIVDTQSRLIVDCNEATCRIFGYDRAELVGQTTRMLHVDETTYRHFGQSKLLNETFQQDGSFAVRYQMRRKNGEVFPSEHIVSALYDGQEQPVRVLSTVRDITDEFARAKAFSDTRTQLDFLLDKSPGVLYACRFAGQNNFVPTFCSPNINTLMGYSPDDFKRKKRLWQEGLHPDDAEMAFAGYATLFETGHLLHRYRWRHKDGHYIWIRDEITLIRTSAGEPEQIIGVWVDISEQRNAELELAAHQEDLELTIAERTRQLQQAQIALVRQERLALLGKLSATVSHELRNPLGTINNCLGLLREALNNNDANALDKGMQLASRNIERCDRILSELLDYSQGQTPQTSAIPFDSWLTRQLDNTSWPENVRLLRQLNVSEPVEFDPLLFERALSRVLSNAHLACESAKHVAPEVIVRTNLVNGELRLEVRDNGCGMTPQQLENLYEPLYSTRTFGVGLGMPIARNAIEDQGGRIEVSSREGEGTSVVLILPA